jgi:hypothetical protein
MQFINYQRKRSQGLIGFLSGCYVRLMEELHTDSIDGGHEGQLWARSRARERAYSNTPTRTLTGSDLGLC